MTPKNILAMGKVLITPGELADRISILEIKRDKSFCDPNELYELQREWESLGMGQRYINDLKQINLEGWEVVDKIYQYFDHDKPATWQEIAETCREAHHINKRRVNLKNVINKVLGVERKELKTWKSSTI